MQSASIIELGQWLQSAPGQCLLHWEQMQLDRAVTDVFGYHALQLGLPHLEALRANRMPHRWVASDSPALDALRALPPPDDPRISTLPSDMPVAVLCHFDALPFPDQSIDLVVLPHSLEQARDPHQMLREVERVLVPDGRVMIVGFNPASLWGLRQRAGRARLALGLGRRRDLFLPKSGEFLNYWRLRDWLRLLGFEVVGGRFGFYRPPFSSARWLQRFEWMEAVGERWWPVLGGAYYLTAIKRVRGMRLVGLARGEVRKPRAASAVVASRRTRQMEECSE